MELKGQSVVITGGGSGLGAATAEKFASAGAKVALLDVQIDKATALAKQIGGVAVECDVTSEKSVQDAFELVTKTQGTARIVINCAGIAPGARIVGRDAPHSLDDFRRVIEINLIGSFNILRLSAAAMTGLDPVTEDGERGVIINTASVAAYEGQIGQAAYAASKGGVVGLTLPAARELAKFGVRVVTIAPGLMETPMLTNMPPQVYESLVASTLFPHRLGKATEYAALAQHIVENGLINGETIRLDGGVRLAAK